MSRYVVKKGHIAFVLFVAHMIFCIFVAYLVKIGRQLMLPKHSDFAYPGFACNYRHSKMPRDSYNILKVSSLRTNATRPPSKIQLRLSPI